MLRYVASLICLGAAAVAAGPVQAQTRALKELGVDLLSRWLEQELGLAPQQAPGGSMPPQQFQQFGYQSAPPTYEIRLRFMANNAPHDGVLVLQGNTGLFRVQTLGGVFDQTILVQPSGNDVLLVGSDPRVAGSSVPAGNLYVADTFRLIRMMNGQLAFADICSQGACFPVQVIESHIR